MLFNEFERGCYRLVAEVFASSLLEKIREEEILLLRLRGSGVWHVEGERHPNRKTLCGRSVSLEYSEKKLKLKDLARDFIVKETNYCKTCVLLVLWDYLKALRS